MMENTRKGNFIRIYPSSGSNVYDKLFIQPRPFNRYIYKMIYTEYLGVEEGTLQAYTNDEIQKSKEYKKIKLRYEVKMPAEY